MLLEVKSFYYFVRGLIGVCWLWNLIGTKEYIPWRIIDKGVLSLITDINKDSFNPQTIIAIGRGGAICAGMLLSNIDIARNIDFIATDYHRKKNKDGKSTIAINSVIDESSVKAMITAKRVLLVTGEVHSGGSLIEYLNVLRAYLPEDIRVMSLFIDKNSSARHIVNYHFKITTKEFISPWLLLHNEKQH